MLLTLLVVAIFSLEKIADYCSHINENQNIIRELISDEDTKGGNYRGLKEQNPDHVCWIRIPGTPVDYPVMRTPDEPEKYLRTDFDGNYALCVLPLAEANCKTSSSPIEPECSNTLIYGHHMQDNTMFAELIKYDNQDFADKNKVITFGRIC